MERVLGVPAVADGRRILGRYSAAGGGLLADGLAYAALFAIVPSIVMTMAIAGVVISDPAQRDHAVATIAQVMPPLKDVVDAVLADATRDAGALGVIGLATLLWGASRFVLTFSDALSRVMGRTGHRSVVERNGAAIGAVVLLVAAVLAAPTLAGIASFLDLAEATGVLAFVGGILHIAIGAIPPIATVVAIGLAYRLVPVPAPSWGSVWLPAVVVGVALTLLAQAFAFLAPRLIGAAALLGTIAAVFAALAWLALSFQALLIGGAWTADRDEIRPPTVAPD
jgi:YihY family inner membrane protein